MKRIAVIISMFLVVFAFPKDKKNIKDWWNSGIPTIEVYKESTDKLPIIKVKGARFVNCDGDTILFRGVNIADPDKLDDLGLWNKDFFLSIKKLGANIIRIPVHPYAWRQRGKDEYLRLLDKAVKYCSEYDIYIIIEWHSIGNLVLEIFQDYYHKTTKAETFDFWRTIAIRYNGHNTIAFYELFNEPAVKGGQFGPMSWHEWKELVEKMIILIRAYDPETVILVGGLDWAYDLTHVKYDPVNAENIGYVTHPYPFKRKEPWEPKWEENFGFLARKYPVLATEIGFWLGPGEEITKNHYAYRIIKYLEKRGIGWLAWIYDDKWMPALLKSYDGYKLNKVGEFFKKALKGEIQKEFSE